MAFIERLVRRTVSSNASALEQTRLRDESARILESVHTMDSRLARAEAERDQAVYEYDRLLNFLPAILILKDREGNLIRVNHYTASGFGLTQVEMEGRNQREFWPAEQCDQFALDDAHVLTTGKGKYGYVEAVEYGGSEHTFRTWKVPTFNGSQTPIGVMLFAIDLTALCCIAGDMRDCDAHRHDRSA